jgi:hypothetical protein
MKKHWEALTRFLSIPGCPLDNNICERSLKKIILNRKNSYFFKTDHGAKIGDIHFSILQTCGINGINVLEYYVAVLKNSVEVAKNPEKWFPWNYQNTMIEKAKASP